MADENALESKPAQSIPERPKDAPAAEAGAAPAEGEKGPSKSALKKAAKEKEKAEKAAKRKAAEEAQKKQQDANDVSANDYGELPMIGSQEYKPSGVSRVTLAQIADKYNETTPIDEAGGAEVCFRAVVENARNQSAKLSFLVFREALNTIQAVVAASDTLSRQMVKFAGSVPSESIVLVHGLVKKTPEPVKSATISHLEIHVKKLYVVAKADSQLPMQVSDAERPLPLEGEEAKEDESGRPIVTLNTRLNNRVIDLRGKHNRAIFAIKDGVTALFQE
ncbi:aspartyl-tRNA synthetase, partial [Aureobasidium melanogenum]